MNAGDRIALQLGRLLMRVEVLQDERDQALAALAEAQKPPEEKNAAQIPEPEAA